MNSLGFAISLFTRRDPNSFLHSQNRGRGCRHPKSRVCLSNFYFSAKISLHIGEVWCPMVHLPHRGLASKSPAKLNCRITEQPELEGTHNDRRVQLQVSVLSFPNYTDDGGTNACDTAMRHVSCADSPCILSLDVCASPTGLIERSA